MRNILYPFMKAQYVYPGMKTFLTPDKLSESVAPTAVYPPGRHLEEEGGEAHSSLDEFEQLFDKVLRGIFP